MSDRTGHFVILAALAACGPSADARLPGGDAGAAADGSTVDGAPQASADSVYAHSATELYRVDPDTLMVSRIAAFSFASAPKNLTDIAIDRSGRMVGISLDNVYAIDPETAVASHLALLDSEFSSLSFIPADPADPNGPERLIAASFDGEVFEIDPETGVSTSIGSYGVVGGNQIGSSGDIVSVRGFGTVATVNVDGRGNDHLAWIDGATFDATLIGDTGFDAIFGLGFWGGVVYGFTEAGQFLSIDVSTGAASAIDIDTVQWWGSGVTTIAPIVD